MPKDLLIDIYFIEDFISGKSQLFNWHTNILMRFSDEKCHHEVYKLSITNIQNSNFSFYIKHIFLVIKIISCSCHQNIFE